MCTFPLHTSALLFCTTHKEAGLLIKFIGIAYFIFAVLYAFGFIKINSLTILSFSLSGIFFIFSDIINHLIYEWERKKAIDAKIRLKRLTTLKLFKYILVFLGLFTLIVGSFLKLNLDSQFLNLISTSSSFAALGLAIYKMGLDYDKKYDEFTNNIISDFEKIINDNSILNKKIKTLEDENNKNKLENTNS